MYISEMYAHITRTPAISFRFCSMLSAENGSPRRLSLSMMLSGDFSRVFIASIGLRSY